MKIDFEFETEYGLFRDALYLPNDHTIDKEQIETLKLQRLNNWLSIVSQPTESDQEQLNG